MEKEKKFKLKYLVENELYKYILISFAEDDIRNTTMDLIEKGTEKFIKENGAEIEKELELKLTEEDKEKIKIYIVEVVNKRREIKGLSALEKPNNMEKDRI